MTEAFLPDILDGIGSKTIHGITLSKPWKNGEKEI
jgi:hypothetical protein